MISTNPFDYIKGLEGPIIIRRLAILCGIPIQLLQDDYFLNHTSPLPTSTSLSFLSYNPTISNSSNSCFSSLFTKNDLEELKSFLLNLSQDYYKELNNIDNNNDNKFYFDEYFILKYYNNYFFTNKKINKILKNFLLFYYNIDLEDELFSSNEELFYHYSNNSSNTNLSSSSNTNTNTNTSSVLSSSLYYETLNLKISSLELKINSWKVLNNLLINTNEIFFFYILYINNYYNLFLQHFLLLYIKLKIKIKFNSKFFIKRKNELNKFLLSLSNSSSTSSSSSSSVLLEELSNESFDEYLNKKKLDLDNDVNDYINQNIQQIFNQLNHYSIFIENSTFFSTILSLNLHSSSQNLTFSSLNLDDNLSNNNVNNNISLFSLVFIQNDDNLLLFNNLSNNFLNINDYNTILIWYEKKRLQYISKIHNYENEILTLQRQSASNSSSSPNQSNFIDDSTSSSLSSSPKEQLKFLLFDYILFNEAYGNHNKISIISKSLYEITSKIKNNIELYLKLILLSYSFISYSNLNNYLNKLLKLVNDKIILNHSGLFFYLYSINSVEKLKEFALNSSSSTPSSFSTAGSIGTASSSLQDYLFNYNFDLDNNNDENIFENADDSTNTSSSSSSSNASNYYNFSSFSPTSSSLAKNPYQPTTIENLLSNFTLLNNDIINSFKKFYQFSPSIASLTSSLNSTASSTTSISNDFEKEIKCGLPNVMNALDVSFSSLIISLCFFKSPQDYTQHLFTSSPDNHSLIFGSNKLNLFNIILNQSFPSSLTTTNSNSSSNTSASNTSKNILINFIEEIYYKNNYTNFFYLINYLKFRLNLDLNFYKNKKLILNLLIENLFYLFLQPFSSISFNYLEEKFLPNNYNVQNINLIDKFYSKLSSYTFSDEDLKLLNKYEGKLKNNKNKRKDHKEVIINTLVELLLKHKLNGQIDMRKKIFTSNFVHPSSSSSSTSSHSIIMNNLNNLLNKQEHFLSRGMFLSSYLLASSEKKIDEKICPQNPPIISNSTSTSQTYNISTISNINTLLQHIDGNNVEYDSEDHDGQSMMIA